MKVIISFVLILLVGFVCAVCDDGQIDVNSASVSELDKLSGIGPAKAQAIVDARPYDSLDDLVKAYGIGEITLQNLKDSGRVCVGDSDNDEDREEEKDEEEQKVIDDEEKEAEEEQEVTNIKHLEDNYAEENIEEEAEEVPTAKVGELI